ncbi:UNVERIFIED_CONTAM: hypothetical protein FKN15_035785 [Acipenser sinensis]
MTRYLIPYPQHYLFLVYLNPHRIRSVISPVRHATTWTLCFDNISKHSGGASDIQLPARLYKAISSMTKEITMTFVAHNTNTNTNNINNTNNTNTNTNNTNTNTNTNNNTTNNTNTNNNNNNTNNNNTNTNTNNNTTNNTNTNNNNNNTNNNNTNTNTKSPEP